MNHMLLPCVQTLSLNFQSPLHWLKFSFVASSLHCHIATYYNGFTTVWQLTILLSCHALTSQPLTYCISGGHHYREAGCRWTVNGLQSWIPVLLLSHLQVGLQLCSSYAQGQITSHHSTQLASHAPRPSPLQMPLPPCIGRPFSRTATCMGLSERLWLGWPYSLLAVSRRGWKVVEWTGNRGLTGHVAEGDDIKIFFCKSHDFDLGTTWLLNVCDGLE